jgi:hypothetical protein
MTNFTNGVASFGAPVVPYGYAIPNRNGKVLFVDVANGSAKNNGRSVKQAKLTIQSALDLCTAGAGDVVYVLPGEYNEDLTMTKQFVRVFGAGARNAVRVTGTSAGTKTAVTIDGASDVGLYNLNLEGRTSSGSALELTGQIRRASVEGCKIHGGDQALYINNDAGSQTTDVRFIDCVLANSAIGVNMAYSGGSDPCHQLYFEDCKWLKITTDCVKENGATHDWTFIRPIFGLSDGTEPTRFLDIDETGTTGQVIDARYCTTVFSTGKVAVATGVLHIGWRTEREVEATDGGNNGRPD